MPTPISAAWWRWLRASIAFVLLGASLAGMAKPVQAISPTVVISQVYGAGGNTGTLFRNRYIELFNRGATTVDLTGWSVQYAASSGVAPFSNNITLLSGSLAPGQYYLVQESGGANGAAQLPTPDATGLIQMNSASGKVVLANTTTGLACSGSAGAICSAAQLAQIVDLVGYGATNFFEGSGPAPAPDNLNADFRVGNGCTDTDNNTTDFATAAPSPRNTASPRNPCGGPVLPSLTINDVALNEGKSGTTTFTFNIALSAPAGAGGVTFDIAAADGTAIAPSDYTASLLTGQSIPAGSSTYTFDVLVNGDTSHESNEIFAVNVTNLTSAILADGQGLGTIQDDEGPPILMINNVALNEGNTGTTSFTFNVALSYPVEAGVVTFDIGTADNTAMAPGDYTASSLTNQSIPVGSSTYTFDVLVNGDVTHEARETFFVNVTNLTGAILIDGQGVGTIQDDDPSPPVALDDSSSTNEDSALIVPAPGVLGNDTDADSDSLTAVLVSGPSAAQGTLVLNSDGSFTFTPTADFNGAVSFTYKTNDGAIDSNEATVTIAVNAVNDTPIATFDTLTILEDAAATSVDVLANDRDVDGDTLTVTNVSHGSNGTVVLDAGVITYTPNLNANGTDTFGYIISDGHGGTAGATVYITITPVNDAAPVANPQQVTTNEDTSRAIILSASDVDGDALTYSISQSPIHGTLAGTDAIRIYTPDANYNGLDYFIFLVTDRAGARAAATVSITVTSVNDAPTITTFSNSSPETNEDTSLFGAIGFQVFDVDTLVSSLTLSASSSNTALVPNANMSFGGSGSNRTVTIVPAANQFGTTTITVIVSDGALTSSNSFILTVNPVNDAPVADSQLASTNEDTSTAITLSANDVDGDALTYIILDRPFHGTLSGSGANLTYTPSTNYSGPDSFGYAAYDGTDFSRIATVSISVTSVNDGPIIASISDRATNEDTSTGAFGFSIFDIDTAALSLTLSASSSNTALVPNANMSFGGSGSNRAVTIVPAANQVGTTTITITVSDGALTTSSSFVLTVNAVNDAPVAVNDIATVKKGGSVVIAVRANDSDVDGDPLTITSASNGTKAGTTAINRNGTITFSPKNGFTGTDIFTYTISDGQGGVATGTVTVRVTK